MFSFPHLLDSYHPTEADLQALHLPSALPPLFIVMVANKASSFYMENVYFYCTL